MSLDENKRDYKKTCKISHGKVWNGMINYSVTERTVASLLPRGCQVTQIEPYIICTEEYSNKITTSVDFILSFVPSTKYFFFICLETIFLHLIHNI